MPTGGTMTVSVRDLGSIDPDRPDPDLSAGPFVRISVTDTGIGMDDATRARIFDPFYTTKGLGKGTGLGLSTVFRIVAQSGGHIQVVTAPGKGSTFHVDLPRLGTAVMPALPIPSEGTHRRSGVVLVVEDDPAVREFARRSLEASGYVVLTAAGADEALDASKDRAEEIDVLLTDLLMPGTQGPELAAQVRAHRPDIGVVFMSGYAADDVGRDPQLAVSGEILAKPFNIEALTWAVERAVDAVHRGIT
jgi:two-component system, cell cycle sensor histidine kinase and response regulator CckA